MSVVELNCGKMFSLNSSTGMNAVRQWRCSTLQEADDFAAELASYEHRYPFVEDFPIQIAYSCVVVAIEVSPFTQKLPPGSTAGSPDTLPSYGEYLVTAHYQARMNYDTSWPTIIDRPNLFWGGQLTSLRIRNSGQYLTATSPEGGYYIEGGTDPIAPLAQDVSTCIMVPLRTYAITLDRLRRFDIPKIRNYIGRVNTYHYLGCEPETLLCESASLDHSFAPTRIDLMTGEVNFYRMTVVLTERRIELDGKIYGWNHEYVNAAQQLGGPGFYKVRLTNGEPRYPKIDMTNLLAGQ